MAFYHFRQNNSGGSFDYDPARGISVHVVVEAYNAEHANHRAEKIGLYFDGDGDCSCCGDRWMPVDSYDRENTPCVHGTPVAYPLEFGGWMTHGYETFVHYLDDTFKGFHPGEGIA